MAERQKPLSLNEEIKKRQKDSVVTKLNRLGTLGTFVTLGAVLAFPAVVAPAALGFDIMTNVAGEKIKEANDKKIANEVRGSKRFAAESRLAKAEGPEQSATQKPSTSPTGEPTPIRRADNSPNSLAA